jgi:hypothetical protein
MKVTKLWMWLLAALILVGCAGKKLADGQSRLLEAPERPVWVDEPERESNRDYKAYAGVSRQYSMEQQARNDARLNAYIQAIDDMGVYGKRKIQQVASEVGVSTDIVNPGIVQDVMTKMKSEGVALGEVTEWHVLHYEMKDGNRMRPYVVATCLFKMPRTAAQDFMEQVLRQQELAAENEQLRENINRALERMKEMDATDW